MSDGEDFRDAMRAAGLEPPEIIEPGRLHRFPTNGRRGDDAGWCRLFPDMLGGVFGDFRSGLYEVWQAKRDRPFSPAEREAFRQRCEQERREREAEQERRYAEAAEKAKAILDAATGDPAAHPYAIKKSVRLGPLVKRGAWPQRGWADALLIPMFDAGGSLATLEAISTDGEKDFLFGGKKKGCFHPFNVSRNVTRLLVGEGLATVAAACQASGLSGVAAMDAGNLEHAARAIKEQLLPDAEIIFLADNDADPKGKNTGIEAATKAARAVGGRIAIPELAGRKCDFWDVWHERDAEAVREAIENARPPAEESGDHQTEDPVQAALD